MFSVNCIEKDENTEKRVREWPIFLKKYNKKICCYLNGICKAIEFKKVKLETSSTVVLPPRVSVLCIVKLAVETLQNVQQAGPNKNRFQRRLFCFIDGMPRSPQKGDIKGIL